MLSFLVVVVVVVWFGFCLVFVVGFFCFVLTFFFPLKWPSVLQT